MRLMILAAAALALCGSASAQSAPQPAPAAGNLNFKPERVELPASKGRKLPVTIWAIGNSTGPVVIFNHGLGGEPEAYRGLLETWAMLGLTVVAPIEPDSHASPGYESVDLPTGFGLRTEDLMIVRGYVASRYPRTPVFLAGHSYGSLFAMMGGGAVTAAGPLGGPPVAGVVAFSTPGKIEGVVQPTTFASLKVPLLLITGTADTVPGFVPNAADHRFAFDTAAPGDKMLVTFKDGAHDLVRGGASTSTAWALSAAFFEAYSQTDPAMRAEFRAIKPAADHTIEIR